MGCKEVGACMKAKKSVDWVLFFSVWLSCDAVTTVLQASLLVE